MPLSDGVTLKSWAVVPVKKRDEYMEALETAIVKQDIAPFAKSLGRLVSER